MTAKTNKGNPSAKRKLIPATGMLLASAIALTSATYAWFTMSREVEVTNISMVATTPEDIQISLGTIGTAVGVPEKTGNGKSLKNSTGVLVESESSKGASNGQVKAPSNEWDWSNIADISSYYAIGKLIPASSTSGASIFFTPNADGVGKTISSGAEFIQADASVNGASGATDSGTTKSYKATLHAFTQEKNAEKWSGATATAYNATNDDGYYVDIPVWLRTSSTEGAEVGVKAYVAPKSATKTNNDGEALYRAVRVAILNGTPETSGASITPTGLLPIADGWENMTSGASGSLKAEPFGGSSILNWYNHSGAFNSGSTSENVAAKATGNASTRFDSNIYDKATVYGGGTMVTLTKGSGQKYGAASQAIIRVWLEGEDPDCWNATAGQDWNINLKFYNTKTGATSDSKDLNVTAGT